MSRKATEFTEKQMVFIECVALKRMSLLDAYSTAFDVTGMKASTIAKRGSELFKRPDINAEINLVIEGARRASVKAASYTLDDAIADVEEGMNLAKTNGQSSAYVQAVKLKAQLAGHVIDRKEVSTKDPLATATLDELGTMRDEITRRILAAKAAEADKPQALPLAKAA